MSEPKKEVFVNPEWTSQEDLPRGKTWGEDAFNTLDNETVKTAEKVFYYLKTNDENICVLPSSISLNGSLSVEFTCGDKPECSISIFEGDSSSLAGDLSLIFNPHIQVSNFHLSTGEGTAEQRNRNISLAFNSSRFDVLDLSGFQTGEGKSLILNGVADIGRLENVGKAIFDFAKLNVEEWIVDNSPVVLDFGGNYANFQKVTLKKDLTLTCSDSCKLTVGEWSLAQDATLTLPASLMRCFSAAEYKPEEVPGKIVVSGGEVTFEEVEGWQESFDKDKKGKIQFLNCVYAVYDNIVPDLSEIDGQVRMVGNKNTKLKLSAPGEDYNWETASIDFGGGTNSLEIGAATDFEVKNLSNLSKIVLSSGKCVDDSMKITWLTVYGDSHLDSATVKVGNNSKFDIEGKINTDSGYLDLSFGNNVEAIMNSSLNEVNKLAFGGKALYTDFWGKSYGTSELTVKGSIIGRNTNTAVSFGTYATVTIGDENSDDSVLDLRGGSNTLTFGSNSDGTLDCNVLNVKTLTLKNGIHWSDYPGDPWYQEHTSVTIFGKFVAPLMNNTISVGNFADLDITGGIDNSAGGTSTGTTIKVGANSTLIIGTTDVPANITGLESLTVSGGTRYADSASSDKSRGQSIVTISGDVTGTDSANKIQVKAYSQLTISGDLDLLTGKNTITVANFSKSEIHGDVSNLQSVTLTSGNGKEDADGNTSQAVMSVDGSFYGAKGNVTLSIGNYADFTVSGGILDSDAGSVYTMSIGTNATVTIGSSTKSSAIQNLTKLTVKNSNLDLDRLGKTLCAGTVTATDGDDKYSLGSNNDIELGHVFMGGGNDVISIGSNSIVKIKGLLDFGDGAKNQLSIGQSANVTIDADIWGVNKLTCSSGTIKKVDGSDNEYFTTLVVSDVTGTAGDDVFSFGSYTDISADKMDLKGGKNTVSIGKAGKFKLQGDLSGVTKFTAAAGKNGDYMTKITIHGTFNGTEDDNTVSFGNWNDVTLNQLDLKDGKNALAIGSNSSFQAENIKGVSILSIGNESEVTIGKMELKEDTKITIGKNESIVYVSSEKMAFDWSEHIFNKKNKSSMGKNSRIDAGEHKDDTAAKADEAQIKLAEGGHGWLGAVSGIENDGFYNDFTDFFAIDGAAAADLKDWKIVSEDGKDLLSVGVWEKKTGEDEGWTKSENTFAWNEGGWSLSPYNPGTDVESVLVEVSISDTAGVKEKFMEYSLAKV